MNSTDKEKNYFHTNYKKNWRKRKKEEEGFKEPGAEGQRRP